MQLATRWIRLIELSVVMQSTNSRVKLMNSRSSNVNSLIVFAQGCCGSISDSIDSAFSHLPKFLTFES